LKKPVWAVILLALWACVALAVCAALIWFLLGLAKSTPSVPVPSAGPAPTLTMPRLPAASSAESLLADVQVPFADPYDLARRLKHMHELFPQPTALAPISYAVGDHSSFWVLNLASAESFQISATLRYIGPHLYMWVQDGVNVAQDALEQSAETFEERLYPTVRRYFGSESTPGIDNDVRLTVLNAHLSGASGYFSSSDQYPPTVVPTSNGREMVYLSVDGMQLGTSSYDATLAHELQHMVHWFADPNEDSWVNEGCSELAEHLCGYSKDARIRVFAANPDIQLTNWEDSGLATAHYAASFLFMAYFAERFGPDWTRDLVASPKNGSAGFDSVLEEHGTALSFADVFADWAIANYLDGESNNRDVTPYLYQGLDIQVQPERVVSAYPTEGEGSVNQYGADYIELGPSAQDLQLEFHGEATTHLVPNTAHSGYYQWWSNRGDNSDMTLTRAFDLQGLSTASLQAWLWYDIEDGWDYAYVEASADGGETWQILPGQHTTTKNPSGQSYGPGYTGCSGEDADVSGTAQWIEETVDLSPFAGRPALIRFEYITDDAVNHFGLCVDDIRVPELGYSYDAEGGDDGWVAEGFVRTDNTLPQHYLVQLIRLDGGATVRRLWVEGKDGATLSIPHFDGDTGRSILVISAVTKFSDEPAHYQYEIQPMAQTESPADIRRARQ
jgi:immune inhibitor A